MSIKATNWAWEQNLPPSSKFVLIALANNADDQGYCWPKIKTIAAKCCVSERTAQRLVKDLLDSGLLKISARFNALGGQVSNGYTLQMSPPDKLSPSPLLIPTGADSSDTPGVTQLCQGGSDTAMSPLQPPYESKEESSPAQPKTLSQLSTEERGKTIALLAPLSQEQRNEVTELLREALAKKKIQTSPSRWLLAVLHRKGYALTPNTSPHMTEQDFVQKLIQGGISPEDAQHIANRQRLLNPSRPLHVSAPQVSIKPDHQALKRPRYHSKGTDNCHSLTL